MEDPLEKKIRFLLKNSKLLIFEKKTKIENFEQSHSAEIHERETLWGFETLVCCKISKKLEGGTIRRQKNIRKKVAQFRKKMTEGILQSRPLWQMLEKDSG